MALGLGVSWNFVTVYGMRCNPILWRPRVVRTGGGGVTYTDAAGVCCLAWMVRTGTGRGGPAADGRGLGRSSYEGVRL